MATYILVDTANILLPARHVVRGDIDTKVGMAFLITLPVALKRYGVTAMQIMLCFV